MVAGCILEESPKLEGTLWILKSYVDDGGGMVNVLSGTETTAQFQGGNVGGSAGCNTYSGSYTLSGNAITIGTLTVTLMFCTKPGIMDQETAYLSALGSATTYKIKGSTLEMSNADGKLILVFEV
ncbi:MAG: META domain-containing protein [Methanomicrobia archaeon]|nr:META domain-containing protein [Methanomicrobia archaeon]